MSDNFESAAIKPASDSNTGATQALLNDAYRPDKPNEPNQNKGIVKIIAESPAEKSVTEQLFGSINFFDSSKDVDKNKISELKITNQNGTQEVLGIGSITVVSNDGFDWQGTVDSVQKHVQTATDALVGLFDRVGGVKPEQNKSQYDSSERDHLIEAEAKITDPARRALFDQNMATFEKRASEAKPRLDVKEVAETYEQIARLLDAKSSPVNLNSDERSILAEQIMHHAAHSDRIDQGNYSTCSVAALESQIFTKDPSAAAKLIVDQALTAEFADHEGNIVWADRHSLTRRDNHNMDIPPRDGHRSMASQIFQTSAIKMIYQDYRQDTPGRNGPSDTGERIGIDDEFPGLHNGQLREINHKITGSDNSDTLIDNAKDMKRDPEGLIFVDSASALDEHLAKLKEEGKLPAIISVDTRNEPFYSDTKGNFVSGSGGAHDVTISDYIPGTPPHVVVKNQWGEGADHTLSVDQLYYATLPPGDHETVTALKSQVGSDIDDINVDPRLKLELLRQERLADNQADSISLAQYQNQIARVMIEAEKRWNNQDANGHADENERAETWYKFNELALRPDGGAHIIGKQLGAELKDENDPELSAQVIRDHHKYSKQFIAALSAKKSDT